MFSINGKKNELGQTILIILFVMIIALSIGIVISNRFVNTLRTSTRTYTAFRAQAVAEAATERILLQPISTLEDYINFGSCGSDCFLEIINADGITETASVELSYLGNSADPFEVSVNTEQVAEINLEGYDDNADLDVCWNNPSSGEDPSIFGMLIYSDAGVYKAETYAYNPVGSTQDNGFLTATGGSGYINCFTVNTLTSPQILRLRSFYNQADLVVIPAAGTSLPSQGVLIETTGQVLDATKRISVAKGRNMTPVSFDYVLYSKSEDVTLSN